MAKSARRGGRSRSRKARGRHAAGQTAGEPTQSRAAALADEHAPAGPAVTKPTTARDTGRPAIKPFSPAASVEEQDGAIVIRFPPVAPLPFAPPPQRGAADSVARSGGAAIVGAGAAEGPSGARARATPEREPRTAEREPPDWDDRPRETVAVEEPAEEIAESEPPRRAAAGSAPPAEQNLTPSQKRRLRRKRNREKKTVPAPPTRAEPLRAEPARVEPARVTEFIARDERPARAKHAAGEASQDPTPWLEAAEAIKAGLSRADLEPTEEAVEEAAPEAETPPAAEAPPVERPAAEEAPPREKGRRRRRRGRRSSRRDAAEEAGEEAKAPPAEAPRAAPTPAAGPTPVREMVINAIAREECRIATLMNGRLEEIYLERAAAENHVGNIYKGVVTNVEPSIQAAFVDFGQGKNGFLHISDLHPQYFPNGAGHTENVGHKTPRRSRPPIQRCLRRGQELIVQVTKEGIGTKGPTLSTYLSIPGRFLVMMPGMGRLGVSRRIEDDDSRDKLRKILAELDLPDGMGFIARTAAFDRTKRELQGDLTYLTRLWRAVENRVKTEPAPAELYRESDLVIRTIRDVFTSDVERIVVDDPEVAGRARDFLSIFSPRSNDIVTIYADPEPIFHKYGIEAELERLHSRRVPLKSGGSLVIDQTEALVAIDVNSGRFRTEDDAEATAYKMNIEASDEIPRQLRLRDLGGVIICDFIDMRMESHRREIERRLARNLKEHKERAKVLRMSEFGVIELTRQRQRASLTRSVYQDCRHCRGTGLVKSIESVALDVMRLIQLAVTREHIHTIEVSISPEVAFVLQNRKRRDLHELEAKTRRIISIRPDPAYSLDQVEIRCTDPRGRLVPHT